MKQPIFRKEVLKRISSPEQLNDYIRVSNPAVWIVIAAFLILIAGCAVWMAASTLETNVTAYAMREKDGTYVAYLAPETAATLTPGMAVTLGDASGIVYSVDVTPLSFSEARILLPNDFTAAALGLGDWNVRVTITADSAPDTPGGVARLVITTASESPLSLIF